MKKIFRTLAIVAVAALGLTACENDINEQIKENDGDKVTVEVVASTPAGTRSAFGDKVDGAYTSTWSKDQVVYFTFKIRLESIYFPPHPLLYCSSAHHQPSEGIFHDRRTAKNDAA